MEEYIVRVHNDKTEWWQNGKRHRLDGPAVEYSGSKEWYQNGKLHRLDGPAYEGREGTKEWYIDGKYYKTEKEFLKATQPATELTVAEIARRLGISHLKIIKG